MLVPSQLLNDLEFWQSTALFWNKDASNLIRKIYFYSLLTPPYFSFTFLNGPYYHHSFWTMQKGPLGFSLGRFPWALETPLLSQSISHEILSTNLVFKISWANNNIKGKVFFAFHVFLSQYTCDRITSF